MEFRAFADYEKGYSHTKNGTDCEDYSQYYTDQKGRYFICAVCDGHSDNNCFRSAKGARFGCEVAIEVLSRFFELIYAEGIDNVIIDSLAEERLKKSIKQSWDQKVRDDLRDNPIQEDELERLSDRVRNYYLSGKGLLNIYGATFLAIGISKEYCATFHIGDGVMLLINEDGTYFDPLEDDEKSEMGSPASLCDTDLFSREHAFRSKIFNTLPVAGVVSSDGIGDCMDQYQFMESIHGLFAKFELLETYGDPKQMLNEGQQRYLNSLVDYYTKKGNGVEDDCSLAGIYAYNRTVPEVKLPLDVAEKMLEETIQERNKVVKDYEKRKKDSVDSLRDLQRIIRGGNRDVLEILDKIENLKNVIRNIEKNEAEKIAFYDEKIKVYDGYVSRAGGIRTMISRLVSTSPVDSMEIEPDDDYAAYKRAHEEYQSIVKRKDVIREKIEGINEAYSLVTQKMVSAESNQMRIEAKSERSALDDKLESLQIEKQNIEAELETAKKRVEFAVMKIENQRKVQGRPLSQSQSQHVRIQQESDYVLQQRRREQTSRQPIQSQSQGFWPFSKKGKKGGDET